MKLYRFPRDPSRRQTWIVNCRRDKFKPSDGSRLCAVHFEESQFEQHRKDGFKKLKPNAVPTLFNFPNSPQTIANKRKPPRLRLPLPLPVKKKSRQMEKVDSLASVLEDSHAIPEAEPAAFIAQESELHPEKSNKKQEAIAKKGTAASQTSPLSLPVEKKSCQMETVDPLANVFENSLEIAKAEPAAFFAQQRELNMLKVQVTKLKKMLCLETRKRLAFEQNVGKIFNEDQLLLLQYQKQSSAKGIVWSDATIEKSIEMRVVMGEKAYKHLRSIGYPLPSLTTLKRRLSEDPDKFLKVPNCLYLFTDQG